MLTSFICQSSHKRVNFHLYESTQLVFGFMRHSTPSKICRSLRLIVINLPIYGNVSILKTFSRLSWLSSLQYAWKSSLFIFVFFWANVLCAFCMQWTISVLFTVPECATQLIKHCTPALRTQEIEVVTMFIYWKHK